MMNQLFNRIRELQEEINTTNSRLEKKAILKKYEDLKEVLIYVYDTDKKYNITSKNLIKYTKNNKKQKIKPITIAKYLNNLFLLLDDLNDRKITGDIALNNVYWFVKKYSEFEDIIHNILDKNLKIRINKKEINDVFDGLITEFSPVLAQKFEAKRLVDCEDQWYMSRKLDGVRCLIRIEKKTKKISFFSRQGKEFLTLDKLKENILNNFDQIPYDCVLDGEIVIVDENGQENFKNIMEQIKRKNYTMNHPSFYCFDIIKLKDFYNKTSKETLLERKQQLDKLSINGIIILEQLQYNQENFDKYLKMSTQNNWEGIMLRKNVGYEGKRTTNLLKYKSFMDEEFKVSNVIIGKMRIISKETGLEDEIETLTAVMINYGEEGTKVGSGFTLDERIYYSKHPEEIEGKIITVKYFEKTEKSLRFPIFKCVHGIKRDT